MYDFRAVTRFTRIKKGLFQKYTSIVIKKMRQYYETEILKNKKY